MRAIATSINIQDRPMQKPGDFIRAYADLEIAGFRLQGCMLVEYKGGRLGLRLPNTPPSEKYQRGIAITDRAIYDALLDEALSAYTAMKRRLYAVPAAAE